MKLILMVGAIVLGTLIIWFWIDDYLEPLPSTESLLTEAQYTNECDGLLPQGDDIEVNSYFPVRIGRVECWEYKDRHRECYEEWVGNYTCADAKETMISHCDYGEWGNETKRIKQVYEYYK